MPLVELRIHGVSGTPPDQMLDTPLVQRVAGDDDAGFWRPRPPAPEQVTGPDRVLEGYSWGGLTSRAAASAAWVLLAPFALVNAAAAMHLPRATPPEQRRSIARGWEGAAVRVFAFLLTLGLVLTAYIAAVDVGGWQCGNDPTCPPRHQVTRFLGQHWLDTPEKRVAITTLVPIALIGLLWLLARRSWQRYETFPSGGAGPMRPDAERTPFDDPGFWDGKQRTAYLRYVHVGGAFAFLAALTMYTAVAVPRDGTSIVLPAVVLALALLWFATAVALLALPVTPATCRYAGALWKASAATLALALVVMWFASDLDASAGGQLPAAGVVLTLLFATELLVVTALFARGASDIGAARAAQIGLGGCGTACTALVGLVLGGAFCAGTIVRVSDFVGVPATNAHADEMRHAIVVPNAITWAAFGVTVALAAIVVWGIAIGARIAVQSRHERATVQAQWDRERDDRGARAAWAGYTPTEQAARTDRTRRRQAQIARAIARAKLTDRAGVLIGPATVIALVVAVVTLVPAVVADLDGAMWATDPSWRVRFLSNAGSWVIVAFAIALIAVTYRSYRSPNTRRTVGILWDLTTFWPRSAHPLAPPCYAERTVPEFAARTAFYRIGDPDYAPGSSACCDVVVSAHSQGTVISCAMLLSLDDLTGIALVTYGSPLRRLYARYFPSYFDEPTLRRLETRLDGRWRNLYRDTDPIGAAVRLDGTDVDVHIDIPTLRQVGDTTYPAIEAHSRYQREPQYHDALVTLAARLAPATPVVPVGTGASANA